jgi:IS30 family transposase
VRRIAERIGRSPSTVSRELRRNGDGRGGYRATSAHALAWQRAARPKPAKLAANLVLRAKVEQDLGSRYSPEQIAGRLRREFPDDPEMWVSHETIYQSLYVQSSAAPGADGLPADGAGDAPALPQGRAAQEPHPGHDQHLGAAS